MSIRAGVWALIGLPLALWAAGCGARIVGDGELDSGMRCPEGTTRCDGICVDTDSDSEHCGACGAACGVDETCIAGSCEIDCPSGQEICDGVCVVTQNDRANCGACGNACGEGEVCSLGECATSCAEGLLDCGGSCRDTSTDRGHCGACDLACVDGQVCSAGACVTSCAAELTDCDGSCRDTQTDRANCGGCGIACDAGEVCSGGMCATSCGGGLTECSGVCRDLTADRRHCGACDAACLPGTVCSDGMCTTSCGGGLTDCGGSCRDTQTDRANCGECGTTCAAGEVCSAGVCQLECAADLTNCGGRCRDTATDRAHCGACDDACAAGEVCSDGTCALSCGGGLTECSGVCRDLSTNRLHCGACDASCAAGEVCVDGACALSCGGGLTDCSGTCRDLDTDRNHCGACGDACAAGEVCVDGACELSCPGTQVVCGGVCVDLTSDRGNCGMCGNTCGAGQVCSMSACTLSCAAGLTNCSGDCVNTRFDPSNCTACGTVCGPYANATASCRDGCLMTCDAGFVDCDASRANGCEAELAADEANCGRCGVVCSFANAGAMCDMGTCRMGTCNAGFADCDGSPTNGCECRVAVVGPTGEPPFSGGTIRDLTEDPATGAISPSGMVTDTSQDFLWVVNVGESTVSRWDASMRREIARYRVGLAAGECAGRCCHESGCNMPSRVVVDGNGDAYIANRAFGFQGTVTKIAGDISQCVDRNGNGMIDTSTTATPMAYGADECVLWTANVGPVDAVLRSITIDRGDAGRPNGYVWVGSFNRQEIYRLDPVDGALLNTIPVGVSPYGMVVTRDGRLWMSTLGPQIRPIDTTTRVLGAIVNLPWTVYGPTADANGRLWFTTCCWGNIIGGYDPMTGQTTQVTLRNNSSAGVTVDAAGNVWVGVNEGATRSTFARLPITAFVGGAPGIIPASAVTYFDGPANPTGSAPTAIGVDRSGAVWLASYTGNSRLLRLDPTTSVVTEFTGPNRTYSYSDFTGSVRRASIPQGSYEQTFDLGCASPTLGVFEIDGSFPADTSTTISMRTAATTGGLTAASTVSIGTLPPIASPYALPARFTAAGVTPQQQLRVTLVLRASAAGAVPIVNRVRLSWTCP